MGKHVWVLLIWAISILIGSVVLAQSIGFDDVKEKPYDARGDLQAGDEATDYGKIFEEDAVSP